MPRTDNFRNEMAGKDFYMKLPALGIVIPTYNRNSILYESVRAIIPQLSEECTLVVIDNDSPVDPSDEIKKLHQLNPKASIKVMRNLYNIGAPANVIRAMEVCSADWVWVLGDD